VRHVPTIAATHRVRVVLAERFHAKLTRIVEAERKLRRNARFSAADKIVELVRDHEHRPRSRRCSPRGADGHDELTLPIGRTDADRDRDRRLATIG
jgi:hypothetical protein